MTKWRGFCTSRARLLSSRRPTPSAPEPVEGSVVGSRAHRSRVHQHDHAAQQARFLAPAPAVDAPGRHACPRVPPLKSADSVAKQRHREDGPAIESLSAQVAEVNGNRAPSVPAIAARRFYPLKAEVDDDDERPDGTQEWWVNGFLSAQARRSVTRSPGVGNAVTRDDMFLSAQVAEVDDDLVDVHGHQYVRVSIRSSRGGRCRLHSACCCNSTSRFYPLKSWRSMPTLARGPATRSRAGFYPLKSRRSVTTPTKASLTLRSPVSIRSSRGGR